MGFFFCLDKVNFTNADDCMLPANCTKRNGNSSDFRASTCEIPHACIFAGSCELPFEQINHQTTQEMEKWEEVGVREYIL